MSLAQSSLLFTPYTLMEEEALCWTLLFSSRVTLLQPFHLDLPEPCRKGVEEGTIRILTPSRTQEEIRKKDRLLREFQRFVTQNPDFSFLEYLKRPVPLEPLETRDEILALLGGRAPEASPDPDVNVRAAGELLLCLIHDWLTREWEIDRSLGQLEKQEKALADIMESGFAFSEDWTPPGSDFRSPAETELVCPVALEAWNYLKNRLATDSQCLLTNQRWVRSHYYRSDPDGEASLSLPLPGLPFDSLELFLEKIRSWNAAGLLQPVREGFRELISGDPGGSQKAGDLRYALGTLGLHERGRYTLVFPPFPPSTSGAEEPLLLLTRTG